MLFYITIFITLTSNHYTNRRKLMTKQRVKTLVVSTTALHRRAANKAVQKSHWSGSISNSASCSAAKMDFKSSATDFSYLGNYHITVYVSMCIHRHNNTEIIL
jgi:hypothetical protein